MNHFDFDTDTLDGQDMSSLNHSLLQARLVKLIDDRFVPLTELSLDITSSPYARCINASLECNMERWRNIASFQKYLWNLKEPVPARKVSN